MFGYLVLLITLGLESNCDLFPALPSTAENICAEFFVRVQIRDSALEEVAPASRFDVNFAHVLTDLMASNLLWKSIMSRHPDCSALLYYSWQHGGWYKAELVSNGRKVAV